MSDWGQFEPHAVRVRETLAEHMPFPPHDFIRALSGAGDRAVEAARLARALPPADDLRFIDRLPGAGDLAVIAERLPWDSDFFGCGIARLHGVYPLAAPFYRPDADYSPALRRLLSNARQRGISYLFVQADPRDLALLRALGTLGFAVIENRVYYHLDLTAYAYPERYPVRLAFAEDVEHLARAAREMVNPYDRFHSDPFIDAGCAGRFMSRWVEASVRDGFADATVVPDAPHPTAFTTLRYHQEKWSQWRLKLGQPVLSAVGPEFKGWYKKLLSECNYHLLEVGAEHTYVCTQTTNGAVLRAWEALGYRFGRAELVLRIVL